MRQASKAWAGHRVPQTEGTAPELFVQFGFAAPEFSRIAVVKGDPAIGVGGISRDGQHLHQLPIAIFTLAQDGCGGSAPGYMRNKSAMILLAIEFHMVDAHFNGIDPAAFGPMPGFYDPRTIGAAVFHSSGVPVIMA